MKSPLKVAAFQMATSDDVRLNVQALHEGVRRASAEGAQLLVVPECALSGYLPARDLDFDALARCQAEVAEHAAKAGLWLALGTTRREGDVWFNAAFLHSPAGATLLCYDKTHLMPEEVGLFTLEDALPVAKAGEWTVGIQICFDMRFPENWRILRRKGAELVLHLSNASLSAAWKVPVLEGAIRSRAAENGMFVVSANDARAPQKMVSAICDPDGKDLARAPRDRETMIFAELDRAQVKTDFLAARRTDLWRRPENEGLLLS
jgi:predicted amidohydrolase